MFTFWKFKYFKAGWGFRYGQEKPSEIARTLNCAVQTVRNVIKAFNAQSVVCLQEQSRKPKTVEPIFTADKHEKLRALLHQSPRQYGQTTSTWKLNQVAEVCYDQGLTSHQVSNETIRDRSNGSV